MGRTSAADLYEASTSVHDSCWGRPQRGRPHWGQLRPRPGLARAARQQRRPAHRGWTLRDGRLVRGVPVTAPACTPAARTRARRLPLRRSRRAAPPHRRARHPHARSRPSRGWDEHRPTIGASAARRRCVMNCAPSRSARGARARAGARSRRCARWPRMLCCAATDSRVAWGWRCEHADLPRALFPFCGVGGGALGFRDAGGRLPRPGLPVVASRSRAASSGTHRPRAISPASTGPCRYYRRRRRDHFLLEQLRATFWRVPRRGVLLAASANPSSRGSSPPKSATPKYRAMRRWWWRTPRATSCLAAWSSRPAAARIRHGERAADQDPRARKMMAWPSACGAASAATIITEAAHDPGASFGARRSTAPAVFRARRRKDVSTLLPPAHCASRAQRGEVLACSLLFRVRSGRGTPATRCLPSRRSSRRCGLALIPAGGDWRDSSRRRWCRLRTRTRVALMGRSTKPSALARLPTMARVVVLA